MYHSGRDIWKKSKNKGKKIIPFADTVNFTEFYFKNALFCQIPKFHANRLNRSGRIANFVNFCFKYSIELTRM